MAKLILLVFITAGLLVSFPSTIVAEVDIKSAKAAAAEQGFPVFDKNIHDQVLIVGKGIPLQYAAKSIVKKRNMSLEQFYTLNPKWKIKSAKTLKYTVSLGYKISSKPVLIASN